MPTYGRHTIPGEKGIDGAFNNREVKNRILRAQISQVEPSNGFVTITYENMPSGGRYATVPPLWMSFPDPKISSGPAWGRYMPQESDIVNVAFGYDDSAHIIGYDIVAGKDGIADNESGWPQLNTQYVAATNDADSKNARFAQFIQLNPGEYDFMSSGGAYIYGNNRGRLYLAGGSVSISLLKNDMKLAMRAKLNTIDADDCQLRFGQVRRVDQATQAENPINSNDSAKEFSVSLATSGDVKTPIAKLSLGDLYDDNGQVITVSTIANGTNARKIHVVYDTNGQEVFREAIDDSGNWVVESLSDSTHRGIYMSASNYTINADKILLGGGTTANNPDVDKNPLILSDQFVSDDKQWNSDIASLLTRLTTLLETLNTALSAFSTGLNPATVTGLGVALKTAVSALQGQFSAVAEELTAKKETFNNNWDSRLSDTTYTK